MTDSTHIDLYQRYDGNFWTVCSCGLEFGGWTPDEADWHQLSHLNGDTEGIADFIIDRPGLRAAEANKKENTQ